MPNTTFEGEPNVLTVLASTAVFPLSQALADGAVSYGSLIAPMLAVPGQLFGGKFTITIASGNLTIAIETTAGNDPSATEPVWVNIAGTIRVITAATSSTKNAGTSWGAAGAAEHATKAIDWFPYVVWDSNSSVVAISASRYPGGRVVSDFNSTTTNEKYLFDYTNFTSTDPVETCGRFEATLSAGAGYTWTSSSYSAPTNKNTIYTPIRKTRALDWLPTITGYSANPTNVVYQYMLDDTMCCIFFREVSAGTSNATTLTYTAPWTSVNLTNGQWSDGGVLAEDNSAQVTTPARAQIPSNSAVVTFYKNSSTAGTWTGSGTKRILNACITYPIGS